MSRNGNWFTVVGVTLALATHMQAADIAWVPFSADGAHTIVGDEIILQGGGQIVRLDIMISGWDPDLNGVPELGSFQAAFDSTTLASGSGAPLTAFSNPDPSAGAFQIRKRCTVNFQDDPSGQRCDLVPCPAPEFCIDNTDLIVAGFDPLCGVATIFDDYEYFCTTGTAAASGVLDDGTARYGGTLLIVVPPTAAGTYTIAFKNNPQLSFLLNFAGASITPVTLTAAKITLACQNNTDCDDGSACTTDVCDINNRCVNTPTYDPVIECCNPATGTTTVINDGNECTLGVCDAATGVVTQQPQPSGTTCGNAAVGECDAQDTCDGAGFCVDRSQSMGTPCGDPTTSACDDADTCDGLGACRANPRTAGTACGDPTNTECNGADTCDGNGVCLANVPIAGTACGDPTDLECDNPDTCDGVGSCLVNNEPTGLPCGNPVGNQCDDPDTCNGSGVCQTNALPAGTACGDPSISECDNADVCDGVGVCSGNNVPDGTVCTDDGNECRTDICQGGQCTHPLAAAGVPCGDPSNTECDGADTCDGTGVCATNLQPAGAACGSAVATDCDGADSCDGAGACATNLVSIGTSCGDPSDTDCDDPDTCDGLGGCQANVSPSGLPCGNQVGNQCDDPDTCDGAGVCNGNFVLAGTACGNPGMSECDNPDTCDGIGACAGNRLADGTPCTDDGNECRDDVCLAGTCAHPLLAAGTACGDPTASECDNADSCDGTGGCLPNLVSAGTACGDPSNTTCTGPDTCNGFGACLTNNMADGTNCDDGSFCNAGATCVGGACGGASTTDCDDGLTCTVDSCNEALAQCDNILQAGFCLIAGVCYADGQINPANSCQVCSAAILPNAWDTVAVGTLCDDGDPCTGTGGVGIGVDACDATGTCVGTIDPTCNDDCINAVEVFDGTNNSNNQNRGPDDDEATCQFDSNNDIWFFYVATCTGPVVMNTNGSVLLPYNDTVLTVYGACGGAEIACDDDNGAGLLSSLVFNAVDSQTYLIRIAGFMDNVGDTVLNISTVDGCVIGGVCYSPGQANPANDCEVCIPLLSSTNWSSQSAGVLCGDITNTDCDAPDTCNGLGVCEVNHKSNGELCTDDANDCTDDVCFSGVCTHPDRPVGTACGDPLTTECDNADTCDGAGLCRTNFVPVGVPCGDPTTSDCDNADVCDGLGACDVNHQPDGLICTDDGNECTLDLCSVGVCQHPSTPAGALCGDGSNTQCDNPDTCDGNSVCVSNFELSGTVCGDSTNTDCNNPDSCDGAGTCLSNFEPVGMLCGSPTDTGCDNPDTCDGGGSCLANLEINGFPCGDPSNTQCNNPDTCDGSGACLDNFEPAGLACGDPSTSDCDNADVCDGVGLCDPNHQADGVSCTDEGNECTLDLCATGVCVHPPRIAGFPCGDPTNTQCDNPDTCDGNSTCLSNFTLSGTACGDPSDTDCDNPDTCSGAGVCDSNFEVTGFACGDPANTDCNDPDTCDGVGVCLDNFQTPGFPCGDPASTQCDNPDTCDSVGVCLSNFEIAGTACGDPSTDQCDNADICDGVGACDNNFVTTGAACDDTDVCTENDTCNQGACAGTAIPQAPLVEPIGPRAFRVTPLPAGSVAPVALRLTSTDWTCLDKFIDAGGSLVDTPVTQLPATWDSIIVQGIEIVPGPGSSYDVQAVCGSFTSSAGTVDMPNWGDVTADGIVNSEDILVTVLAFQLDFSPGFPFEAFDIMPCEPNGIINATDILFVVKAFQLDPYSLTGCPVPCP